jgi:hypothetical protein
LKRIIVIITQGGDHSWKKNAGKRCARLFVN